MGVLDDEEEGSEVSSETRRDLISSSLQLTESHLKDVEEGSD